MLPKINRLTKDKDFKIVFGQGKSFKEGFLILKFISTERKNCRFGIVVSRKISKKAAIRNKVKRRTRAILELMMPKIKKRADIVLLALPGLQTKDFYEIEKTINNLFKKAKII
jgi:ribonuclease P protein component